MNSIDDLYEFIDERAKELTEQHDWWPCKKGCSVLDGANCCSQSFFPVSLTEWQRLRASLKALDGDARNDIKAKAQEIYKHYKMHLHSGNHTQFIKKNAGQVVPCPLLDSENACQGFENRPVICRSFGIFVDQASQTPQWCSHVSKLVKEHDITRAPNYGAVTERMAKTLKGGVRPLVAWLVESSW